MKNLKNLEPVELHSCWGYTFTFSSYEQRECVHHRQHYAVIGGSRADVVDRLHAFTGLTRRQISAGLVNIKPSTVELMAKIHKSTNKFVIV